MPGQAAPCKAGQAAPPQRPHTASLGRGARGLCVPGSPRQHSSALGMAALLLQRCCGGHQRMPSTAVENESLHSTWMLLPPCLPSEGLQKWRSGRSHLTAMMRALRWPKPAVLSWGTARHQQQQAQLAFPPLQSVCTKPSPLWKVRSGITPPPLLSEAAWPGHCLQAGCALSRWDVLPLQTHCSPKGAGLGCPTACSSGRSL